MWHCILEEFGLAFYFFDGEIVLIIPRMQRLQPSWRSGLTYLLLGCGTVELYWQVGQHEFVCLDDPDYVTENAFVKMGLS